MGEESAEYWIKHLNLGESKSKNKYMYRHVLLMEHFLFHFISRLYDLTPTLFWLSHFPVVTPAELVAFAHYFALFFCVQNQKNIDKIIQVF